MSDSGTAMHDPELPILRELEAEFEAELELLQPRRSVVARAPAVTRESAVARRPRWKDRPSLRIARRAGLLLALISLVGGSAVAGRSVLSGSHQAIVYPHVLLAAGGSREPWRFEAYVYAGATCYALFLAETATSACTSAVADTGVRTLSARGTASRLVVGIAGSKVAQVTIRAGRRAAVVATHPRPSLARSGLASDLRWFAVSLPPNTGGGPPQPALVTPRDRDGRPLGPPALDCSISAASSQCQQAAERVAPGLAPAR